MSTVLIPLQAPLQSWGLHSRWVNKDTSLTPTKSGVIGLVANAMGRDRSDPIDDLQELRFGVRVDQPGMLMTDYQTTSLGKSSIINPKDYLMDAKFVAGLETDEETAARIHDAFITPARPLYLGRRNCPPLGPIIPTVFALPLEKALQAAPSLSDMDISAMPMEIEPKTFTKDAILIHDQPVTFNRKNRSWGNRPIIRITPETNIFAAAGLDN